jgi:hypothetical protein
MVDTVEHRAVVEAALPGLAGRPLKISFELREPRARGGRGGGAAASEDEIVARS